MHPPLPTVTELRDAISHKRMSAVEATREALDRATAINPRLNIFLELFPDRAIEQARAVDRAIAGGQPAGPLGGVPIALKDNMCLGSPALDYGKTTCGSKILAEYRSPYTCTAAARLMEAGAVIIGKCNMDEFAMGSSGEHSAFGPTRNPWDPERVPGGSSSGSAAAVAAGIVPASLGSDTGGSIRQPAGLCNIVGMKPTYGRVSRYGLVAFASSLDQIGPFTRTVADCAAMLNVLCGHDPHDSTSAQRPPEDFGAELERGVEGLTIGVPRQAKSEANHPSVAGAVERAVKVYEGLGARAVEVDLPHTPHGIAAYYIINPAEASSNLARFDGIRYGHRAKLAPREDLEDLYSKSRAEGFGREVQRRIMLGTHVLSSGYYDAYYTTALKVRRKIKGDYDAAFEQGCHALLMPSSPTPAFKIGEKMNDPLAMYLEDVYTVGVNLAGLPGIVIPGGFGTVDGRELPVGMQLVGPAFDESRLLRIARMLERETGFGARMAVG
ncbi:MAG: Asp-tRNA(Asn)/Glu-tRNA(Gln) amidotransferase subunit GatA [Phycisphaerales bacterium]|nr:Asp-tRNA(Asn)/Glu-tRNA(Gln) amidotransferase subunit GatA [Phycisphaerales bacterium]